MDQSRTEVLKSSNDVLLRLIVEHASLTGQAEGAARLRFVVVSFCVLAVVLLEAPLFVKILWSLIAIVEVVGWALLRRRIKAVEVQIGESLSKDKNGEKD